MRTYFLRLWYTIPPCILDRRDDKKGHVVVVLFRIIILQTYGDQVESETFNLPVALG